MDSVIGRHLEIVERRGLMPAYRERLQEHFAELAKWREATGDFPPYKRRRAGHTDRITGVFFSDVIPPMRDQ